jgi:hypothetical protein
VLSAAQGCGTLAVAFRCRRRVSEALDTHSLEWERVRFNSLLRISDKVHQISTYLRLATAVPTDGDPIDMRMAKNLAALASLQQLEAAQLLLRDELAQFRVH